jgi:ABC-type uncharacterized transport system permease subunit
VFTVISTIFVVDLCCGWLVGWLVGGLVGWLVGWLVGKLCNIKEYDTLVLLLQYRYQTKQGIGQAFIIYLPE